jgi:hypothetical protein
LKASFDDYMKKQSLKPTLTMRIDVITIDGAALREALINFEKVKLVIDF